jgi:hypothetical protein
MFPSVCTYLPGAGGARNRCFRRAKCTAGPEVRQPLNAVGLDLDGGEERRQRLEDEGISRHKSTDVLAGCIASCIREAERSTSMRRSGSVGIY